MHLGIDLGTSNSAVVGNINSQLRVFKASDGSDVLPSVIYIDQRGHRLYGRRAYEQTRLSPDNVAKGFKRLMGTSTPIKFRASGQVMTPEECSAEILRQLVSQALLETNVSEITGTAITIPAAFNQMQSEATLRAASAAGLDRVVLLQEPIAAAMAQANNNSGQFLVYDLGGGTFDLALVQNLSGSINIIGHEGINMLGGQDFDRILIAEVIRPWLMETFSLPDDFQRQDKYRRLIGRITMAAEAAKIDLSTTNTSTIFISDEDIRVQDENGTDIYLDNGHTAAVRGVGRATACSDARNEPFYYKSQRLYDKGYRSHRFCRWPIEDAVDQGARAARTRNSRRPIGRSNDSCGDGRGDLRGEPRVGGVKHKEEAHKGIGGGRAGPWTEV
jgi:molecular chaperone DnaK